MKIIEILKAKKPIFSFEFFPPKTAEEAAALFENSQSLRALGPDFISVTWGAGGSTRRTTLDLVTDIKKRLGVETMAHLTCVGASRVEIDTVLQEIQARGLENILALRGDPPKGETRFTPHPDGFRYANELVAHIRSSWDFCLGVAGYPEGHIETPDKDKDLDNLKRKADAGADFVTTQLFFDNNHYFRFVERARARGLTLPILPGLMPVTNINQLKRFTSLCGASLSSTLMDGLNAVSNDPEAVVSFGIDWAARQARDLLAGGAPGIHFYTLNRSRSTATILEKLKK